MELCWQRRGREGSQGWNSRGLQARSREHQQSCVVRHIAMLLSTPPLAPARSLKSFPLPCILKSSRVVPLPIKACCQTQIESFKL